MGFSMNFPTNQVAIIVPNMAKTAIHIFDTPNWFNLSIILQKTTPCIKYSVYEYLSKTSIVFFSQLGKHRLSIETKIKIKQEKINTNAYSIFDSIIIPMEVNNKNNAIKGIHNQNAHTWSSLRTIVVLTK